MRTVADFRAIPVGLVRCGRAALRPLLGMAALSLVIGACALPLPGSQPSKTPGTYFLQDETGAQPVPAADRRACLTLRIGSPGSAPGFTSESMAYVRQAGQMEYFAYHQWVDTPARMLAVLMEKRLDSSGLFGAVVSGSPDIRARMRLDSTVIRLQQDFTGASSTIELIVKVKLMDSRDRSLSGARTFSYTEPVGAENPEAGVAAANRAVGQFLSDLVTFVGQSIAPVTCDAAGP